MTVAMLFFKCTQQADGVYTLDEGPSSLLSLLFVPSFIFKTIREETTSLTLQTSATTVNGGHGSHWSSSVVWSMASASLSWCSESSILQGTSWIPRRSVHNTRQNTIFCFSFNLTQYLDSGHVWSAVPPLPSAILPLRTHRNHPKNAYCRVLLVLLQRHLPNYVLTGHDIRLLLPAPCVPPIWEERKHLPVFEILYMFWWQWLTTQVLIRLDFVSLFTCYSILFAGLLFYNGLPNDVCGHAPFFALLKLGP